MSFLDGVVLINMTILVTAVPYVIAMIACLMAWLCWRRQRILHGKYTEKIQQVTEQLLISRSEIKEIRIALLGLGKKIAGLESVTHEVSEKQEELQLIEPDSKLYSRAVKMVELGANVEEIVRECELPQAEAELLVSLHKSS